MTEKRLWTASTLMPSDSGGHHYCRLTEDEAVDLVNALNAGKPRVFEYVVKLEGGRSQRHYLNIVHVVEIKAPTTS